MLSKVNGNVCSPLKIGDHLADRGAGPEKLGEGRGSQVKISNKQNA